jgi:hypothetical protein
MWAPGGRTGCLEFPFRRAGAIYRTPRRVRIRRRRALPQRLLSETLSIAALVICVCGAGAYRVGATLAELMKNRTG